MLLKKKYAGDINAQGNTVVSSNFDMKTYELMNFAPRTDPRSAVNKDQLDLAIQEVIISGGKNS